MITDLFRLLGEATYVIGRTRGGLEWFLCFTCGLTSWNAHDIAQRYCGRCHVFHNEGGAAPVTPTPAR